VADTGDVELDLHCGNHTAPTANSYRTFLSKILDGITT